MVTAAAWLWQFASCLLYKLPSNFSAFWFLVLVDRRLLSELSKP